MIESPKIALYTTGPAWGLPSNSPACAKLETWLRMVEIPYETPPLDFARAPKGKIPFIEEAGQVIGDSTLIIRHLEDTRGVSLERGLSPRERATGLAFRRMLKENTYWGVVHTRYFVAANWAEYRKLLGMGFVPGGSEQAAIAAAEGYKPSIAAAMHAHGLGRHEPAELEAIICDDLQALSDLLGERTWMLGGEGPTTLDATVFGYFGNLVHHPYRDPITDHARSLTNLIELCRRVRARYFPELDGR